MQILSWNAAPVDEPAHGGVKGPGRFGETQGEQDRERMFPTLESL